MSVYLFHKLSTNELIPRTSLVRALGRSLVRRTSLAESLVALDLAYAAVISQVAHESGPAADESWKPDRYLLAELPPGICEQYLAFPFRERGGNVEIATVCPADQWIKREFEQHLGRSVVLYRATLQALLAAARAPIDLSSLARFASQPPPPPEESALPLVRKAQGSGRARKRTSTSPGIGRGRQ